jgi:hypothetical protein
MARLTVMVAAGDRAGTLDGTRFTSCRSQRDCPRKSHLDDRFSVWQPAAGWRFAGDLFHFELALGLPITSNHYFVIDDEGAHAPVRVHVSGVGWTGCGHCDLLKGWPSLEAGGGVHW